MDEALVSLSCVNPGQPGSCCPSRLGFRPSLKSLNRIAIRSKDTYLCLQQKHLIRNKTQPDCYLDMTCNDCLNRQHAPHDYYYGILISQ